jgi:hypothetical protein
MEKKYFLDRESFSNCHYLIFLILSLKTFTEGTGMSLPDSSLNTLQDIPGISPGKISAPLIRIDGEPINLSRFASDSSIL